jgi:hypothetical protein
MQKKLVGLCNKFQLINAINHDLKQNSTYQKKKNKTAHEKPTATTNLPHSAESKQSQFYLEINSMFKAYEHTSNTLN